MTDYRLDAVIIGGGIAGLFTLAKLINAGYHAVLLEKEALGSGQTIRSQGIIHGGSKYALLGKATEAQRQIAAMPDYWRACLSGRGEVDLSACRVLADKQCLWAMPNLSSRVTGFFAGKLMQSRVKTLAANDKPAVLQHPDCRGQFYALDEPVLDVQSLLAAFIAQYGRFIISDCRALIDKHGVTAQLAGQSVRFAAGKIILTAGQGNGEFAAQQLRPLRMVIAKGAALAELFVHVLEASDKPRLTISSYNNRQQPDEMVWYLGGNVAEKGAKLSAAATVDLAKKELAAIFPWVDFSAVSFDSFCINRAEGCAGGKRPNTPIIVENGTRLVAWPTKLALAPMLADSLLAKMPAPRADADALPRFASARVADFIWD